ncbi:MAG: aminotransferase class I/II-fold pyridoxal phosphate-dependent enzyme [Proteobacteria bacterium]|nr:aminotransferase class I/II-fold pyridoxal phosphate-dependent enzyme [Pseudomonadota bacterium]
MPVKIELDAPNLGAIEKAYIERVIDSNFVSTFGPFVPQFEEKIACYLGAKRAVSTQSGTAALHVALYELGIREGDEVIVPALTFVATVNPIAYVNAKPVFADVDITTWNISPEEIERCISPRTKAIIPVHLYGNPCKMNEIMEIAGKYGLFVIEDATESLGAKYKGQYMGNAGDLGCLSFNGNKTITTGGGGMVVGNDEKRMEHVKFLVNQARDESRGYYHPEIGFNYRMTNLEAAMGLAQMERLDEFLTKKKMYNDIYREELSKIDTIRFQESYDDSESSFWFTCITIHKEVDLAAVMDSLKNKGVPVRRVFMPITDFPPYMMTDKFSLKNSHEIYEKGLCLPGSTLNSADDIYFACKAIKEIIS